MGLWRRVRLIRLALTGLNEVDYSHYPSAGPQKQWLRAYLEAYKEHKGLGGPVTDHEVEVLYVQVNRFTLASHFFWGLVGFAFRPAFARIRL
ncbi:hypothetical protein CRUP_018987 [Coryphaenoides rupestris]|nr:hypothetical protein CRUP_018987 [Coryphaenoides rupestris]